MTDDVLIGNEKQFKVLEQCIIDRIPTLIYGPPGIGKTYSVHLIAKKHRYKVVEYNASDQRTKDVLNKILQEVTTPSLIKKLYLFDEFDGMENYTTFMDIINRSFYPIVMTANDFYRIPERIRERLESKVKILRYYPPSKRDIVKFLRDKFGDNVNFSIISDDVRNSIIALSTGAEVYSSKESVFDIVSNIYNNNHNNIREYFNRERNLWIWLLDNLTVFYDNKDLFEVTNILADAALYNKPYVLKTIKSTDKRRNPVYPYFLQRRKVLSE